MTKQVTFKEAWTTNIRNFQVNPELTITQFIQNIKPRLSREFNIEEYDIVVAGQSINGLPSETAPKLQPSEITLKDKWGQNLNVSFYIRRINYEYPQLQRINNESFVLDDCPICLDNVLVANRYSCSHRVCNNCYDNCQIVQYTICPLCRC